MNPDTNTPNLPTETVIATAAPTVSIPAQGKTRGRPKGSATLTNVSLASLTAKFIDQTQLVPVSVKWLRALSTPVKTSSKTAAESVAAATPDAPVGITAGA